MTDKVSGNGSLSNIKSKNYDKAKKDFEALGEKNQSIFLKAADANKDGKVSKRELKEALKNLKPEAYGKAQEVPDYENPSVIAEIKKEAVSEKKPPEASAQPVEDTKADEMPAKTNTTAQPQAEQKPQAKPAFKPQYSKAEPGSIYEKGIYTVKSGDNLYNIVKAQLKTDNQAEIAKAVKKVHAQNQEKGLMGEDAGKIKAGQKLDLSALGLKPENKPAAKAPSANKSKPESAGSNSPPAPAQTHPKAETPSSSTQNNKTQEKPTVTQEKATADKLKQAQQNLKNLEAQLEKLEKSTLDRVKQQSGWMNKKLFGNSEPSAYEKEKEALKTKIKQAKQELAKIKNEQIQDAPEYIKQQSSWMNKKIFGN